MEVVYLDYAATCPMLPEVAERMSEVMGKSRAGVIGNASALHDVGQMSKDILEEAREEIAGFINAEPGEIILTSGGSEANNTVMNIFRGRNIAVSAIEHPSVLVPAKKLAGRFTEIPVDKWGFVDFEKVPKGVPEDVDLVSVMVANNELGTLPCGGVDMREKGFLNLHMDATQAVGKIPIDVKVLGVDYLSFSAHKIGGPVGIGVLYVKSGAEYEPLIMGGHQEGGRRAGTSNAVLAAGFSEAVKVAKKNIARYGEVAKLRDRLRDRILAEIPYSSCNTPKEKVLPNILNMSFQAAEGESIQLYLAAEGIMVSTGSACASGDGKPSHVIMATHNDAEVAHSSVRFSLGLDTTGKEIDRVMEVLPGIIKRLQGISTVKIRDDMGREEKEGVDVKNAAKMGNVGKVRG